ncbi:MAG: glycosyltransferase family 2 protein [Candidatus Bathyarchaeota archaeon]|nr:glycosyltransferase family 2 protein [Candidatus Bathyarchaeota archaeon]
MNGLNEIDCPLVSIIIVNYNGRKSIEKCLNSVLKTNYAKFEVVFVDNGSIDGSIEFAKNFVADSAINMRLIMNQENLGFAEGNNIGVQNSKGKYVVFLNNDTIVDRNWLLYLVALMEKKPEIGAVQSLLLTSDGCKVDSLGGVVDIFGTAEDQIKVLADWKWGIGHRSMEIFSACAASMIVRKSVFEAVGGFDPKFFAYFEDVDLSWRIRLQGYAIVLELRSIVYHVRSATSKKFSNGLFDFHLYKNQIAMLIKNYEFKNLVKVSPGIFFLYLSRIANGLIRNDVDLTMAVLKSVCWNIREFPYLLRQRRFIQTIVRRVSDDQITKLMSKRPLQLTIKNASNAET